MQQVLVEELPAIEITILVVWIDMLAGDDESAAGRSAGIFPNPRIRQFHDPGQHVGRSIAQSWGASNAIAWDTYLFYEPGTEWNEQLPAPLDWVHQLDDPWADRDRFAWGDDLPVRLREIANRLIGS